MVEYAIMSKIVLDTNEVFTLDDAANLLGIGIATLFRWMKKGKLIPLRIDGRTYIPRSEIERLKKKAGRENREADSSHNFSRPDIARFGRVKNARTKRGD